VESARRPLPGELYPSSGSELNVSFEIPSIPPS
jgi:hypothetical protein